MSWDYARYLGTSDDRIMITACSTGSNVITYTQPAVTANVGGADQSVIDAIAGLASKLWVAEQRIARLEKRIADSEPMKDVSRSIRFQT